MKQALAHARTHCALTDGQVRVMPSRLTSSRALRLRGHHAAYDLRDTSNCVIAQGAEAAKGPGGLTHPDLSQMARFRLAKTSFDAETSLLPK